MTNEEDKPRRLRDVAEQLAASIPDSPQRGRDVSNEPRIPKGQSGGGQWTTDGSSQHATQSRRRANASAFLSPTDGRSGRLANTHTPAPFLDDHGNPVLNSKGEPMQRPADVDMRFFVDRGLEVAEAEKNVFTAPSGEIAMAGDLLNFRQGQSWDIQRVDPGPNPKVDPAFVDAANVAIGLYGAAAGIPSTIVLDAANAYAGHNSDYRGATMDSTYTHLSKQSADDIRLGYALYQSGRLGSSRAK